ncbi:hypothetical protein ACFQZ2_01685 [Streptomonospora algeriensis]|uniref:Uncharacterized protein n=1 Tax=Streptomonospora algeriensis TaxID=995084 RepID=A0ABW3BCM0_9ACTN
MTIFAILTVAATAALLAAQCLDRLDHTKQAALRDARAERAEEK